MKRVLRVCISLILFLCGCVDSQVRQERIAKTIEEYFISHPSMSDETKQCIRDEEIRVGMSFRETQLAWRDCGWELTLRDSLGDEVWTIGPIYERDCARCTLHFHEGILVNWIQW